MNRLEEKLSILANAAKYDVSSTSNTYRGGTGIYSSKNRIKKARRLKKARRPQKTSPPQINQNLEKFLYLNTKK